jgi:hypothetical protein
LASEAGRQIAFDRWSHIVVVRIVLHIGRQKRDGGAAGILPPMRCCARFAGDLAGLWTIGTAQLLA